MNNLSKSLISTLVFAGISVIPAAAHPGRTNSAGCHTNKQTGAYHCHGGGGYSGGGSYSGGGQTVTGGSTNSGGYSTQPVQSVAPVRITKPLCESIRIGMSWKDLDSIFGTKGKPMVVGGGAEIKGYVSNGKPEGIFFWIISGGSAAATYQDGILKKFECYYDGGSISIK